MDSFGKAVVDGDQDVDKSTAGGISCDENINVRIVSSYCTFRLVQYAYPSIEGTDHQMLMLYYTVLQSIAEDYATYNLTPKEHIKLLLKVKATSSSKLQCCM